MYDRRQGDLYISDAARSLPPHVEASETSTAAAASVVPNRQKVIERVLCAINASGGLTCDEVERRFGLRHQTASARVYDLRKRGHIKASEITRETSSGRGAIVWIVTLEGRKHAMLGRR